MSRRLYIYYRVAAGDLAQAVAAIRALQAGLSLTVPGLRAELLRRPGAPDEQVTLMETYAAPFGIDEALQHRIEADFAALALPLQGPRHTEVFEPLA